MDGNRRSSRDGPPYCSNCGTGLEPSMNYCSNCGARNGRTDARSSVDREASTGARTRDGPATVSAPDPSSDAVTDRDVLEYRMASAVRDGWELEHDFGDHAVMVRRTFGSLNEHLVVALITIWFTGGLGNVAYGAYRYFGDAERIVLRADDVERGDTVDADGETIGSMLLWRATAAFCWILAAITAVVGVFVGVAAASYVLFALAFVFAAMGVSVLPSVRRRLENRHSLSTNGRTRSVDERSVVAYDRPCAACADPVGRGLERTYRKEFCLFGVPLSSSEGRNYYCKQCATGEASVTGNRARDESVAEATTDRTSADRERDSERA